MKNARSRRAIGSAMEPLEGRWAPAGIITAVMSNENLQLTGDELANGLTITQRPDGRLVLTPDATTRVRLGSDGVLQSGPLTVPFPLRDHLFADLFGGDDRVTLSGVALSGRLDIDAGHGNNRVDLTNVTTHQSASLRFGDGFDTTNLLAEVTVLGNLDILHGDGGSLVNDNGVSNLRVTGDLTIRSGRGLDTVDLDDAQSIHVGGHVLIHTSITGTDTAGSETLLDTRAGGLALGRLDIRHGDGLDRLRLDSDGPVTIQRGAYIVNRDGGSNTVFTAAAHMLLGPVTVLNGGGSDTTQFTGTGITQVDGTLLIDNGNDSAATTNTITGNTSLLVAGDVIVRNGAGADTTTLGGTSSRIVRVTGRVLVENGAGDSSTTIGRGNTELVIAGITRIVSREGADTVVVGATNTPNVTLGPVVVHSGEGTNQTSILGARLNLNGRLHVTGGNATDQVTVTSQTSDGTIADDVLIDLGRGENQRVLMQTANTAAVLNLGRTLSITTRDQTLGGTDVVTLLRLNVRSLTTIVTGAGHDLIAIDDSQFDRLNLDAGRGNDQVLVERGSPGGTTRFQGAVLIATGEGDDTVSLGIVGRSSNLVSFAARRALDGGLGHDTLNMLIGGNALTFDGSPAPTGFEVLN